MEEGIGGINGNGKKIKIKQAYKHFGSLLNGCPLPGPSSVQSVLLTVGTVPPAVLRKGRGQSEASDAAVEKACFLGTLPCWLLKLLMEPRALWPLGSKGSLQVSISNKGRTLQWNLEDVSGTLVTANKSLTTWASCSTTFQQGQVASGGTPT